MAVLIQGKVNDILITTIHTDPKLGTWYAIGTDKEWVEIRTTKTGKLRVFDTKKGKHPYFTITEPLSEAGEL